MITVSNLHKTYGSTSVLRGIDARIPPHKLTSVIGPNAAGKSTLLMVMAGLLKPSTGKVTLTERPIEHFSVRDYARHVATLPQSHGLDLRLTVEELVAFGRFPYSQGRLTLKDHVAIDQAIAFLSLGDIRHRYCEELSGGQRQMARLAMTIAQDTPCLLLDEPLNNLDMHHAVQIMKALRQLCDKKALTVVLVIHDINFAANYSDHILALKSGKVLAQGSVSDVVTEQCLQELYTLEFEILQNGKNRFCNYFNPGMLSDTSTT